MDAKKRRFELVNDTIRAMLENTRDFMFVKDKNLIYVGSSRAFAVDCAGRTSVEEVLGRTDYEVFEEVAFAEKYRKDDEELLLSGKPKIEYRESYPGKNGENRYCLTTKYLIRDEKGDPAGIFGQSHDITRQVELEMLDDKQKKKLTEDAGIFMAMQKVYDVCMYWDLAEDRYFRVYGLSGDVDNVVPNEGNLHEVLQKWLMNDLTEANRKICEPFFDLNTLSRRLTEKGTLSMEIETLHAGWMRISLVSARMDKNDIVTACLWVGEVIEREKKKELAYSKALEDAASLAERDDLTGLCNRKGLENILSSEKKDKVGFAIVDIDNFKSINDNYGHAFGDRVLTAVAESMSSAFYQEDTIARIGGDEFAIFLRDCDETAWNKICFRFRRIHEALAERFADNQEISVTLSAGLCFSKDGYRRSMYQIADEGLYETKKRGRAGCTLVDRDHRILAHWQDDTLSAAAQNVLAYNNTGICRIEIPFDEEKPRCLVCGDSVKQVLGIPKNADSEECYKFWHDRIDPDYRETLRHAERSMKESVQTECTFLWNHPDYGSIYLRCGGLGCDSKDKFILSGYCHALKDTNIVERQTDQDMIFRALNDTFLGSYYLDLENGTMEVFKIAPAREYMSGKTEHISETLQEFISTIVDPRDREIMESFLDMKTARERFKHSRFSDAEYRSLMLGCWCRARLIPVRYDAAGELTHVLLTLTALDSGKFREIYTLDYNRRSLAALFDHLPCGIVMYEWDGKTLDLIHVSEYYKQHFGRAFIKVDEKNRFYMDFSCIHPDDAAECLSVVQTALAETHQMHHEYRVWHEEKSCYMWERVDAVISFQKNNTQLVYALYTDITRQKEQEQRIKRTYEERLQSIAAITENTLCMSLINLTKETYEIVECRDWIHPYVDTGLSLEDYLQCAVPSVVGEKDRQRFSQMFSLQNLTEQVAKGHRHQQIECIFKINEDHYEWVLSAIDLIENPVTGEITGAVYSKSMQTEKMNSMLLKKTLEQDYLFVAAVFVDTDEFYVYNYRNAKYSERMYHYWDEAIKDAQGRCSEEVMRQLRKVFIKQNVLDHLSASSEYTFAYNCVIQNKLQRMEVRFSYADDEHTMILSSLRNITDTELLDKYRHESEHDVLTDLYNRKTMFRKCRELLEMYPDVHFAMVHMDIKHFRLYNTFFGEEAGDKLLCDMADYFRQMDAGQDPLVYGRIEADVFAVFLAYDQEVCQKNTITTIDSLKKYRSDFLLEPAVGIYRVEDREMPIEAMFTRATLAAKMVRPDTPLATVVFDESMEKTLRDDQEILNEMQSAVDQEQFRIYLQPKYSLQTNEPIGAEALVRWIHPKKGLISPERFIPIFEGNGFISVLDRYMWEHACMLLKKWQDEGRTLLPISVNMSRISAYSQDTVVCLRALVEKYGIDPCYLELELTESAYVESPEEIRTRLTELQKYGFRILMDDFGSGYSSLNTLKDLPIDVLKLDMKFLSSERYERGSLILSSMVEMSKLLKLPIIAEGVESKAQADYLRNIGCDYVQGYLFARPMPIADYEMIIEKSDHREDHMRS